MCFLTEWRLGNKSNILKERQEVEATISLRPRPGNPAMVVCYAALVARMEIQQHANLATLFPCLHRRAFMV